jgi:hypothetical protein
MLHGVGFCSSRRLAYFSLFHLCLLCHLAYVVKNSCACVVYMLLEYLESYLNIFRCVLYLYNYCLLCDELSFSAVACVATLSLLFVFLDWVMCEGGGGKG